LDNFGQVLNTLLNNLPIDAIFGVNWFAPLVSGLNGVQVPSILATASTEVKAESSIVLCGVLLSLVAIYLASKFGEELCSRLNLPPVLGDLLGGAIVGVSALHILIFPGSGLDAENSVLVSILQATSGLIPEAVKVTFETQSEVISLLSELGVIILLFEIGLESDLKELIKYGPQAAIVAVVGVVVPFGLGTAGLMGLFHVAAIPAIFAGAALTATSIGITARVLSEIDRLRSKEGQIIIGAAVLDDVLGIIVLAVVSSLVKTGEVAVGNIVFLTVGAAVFLIGSVLLGRFLGPYFVGLVRSLQTRGGLIISAIVVVCLLSYLGAAIHLEAILGAFAAGLVLGETEIREELKLQVVPIADVLVPVFFVVVGAQTDIGVLNPAIPSNREGLTIAVFLVVVAILGKIVTGFTVFGQPDLNRLAIGVGMIPRGEVGLVFAGVGATSGVLSPALQAAIIVMVIVTTCLAPPGLRLIFSSNEEMDSAQEEG
jgi:Kef-type K+ transport system membrane component KefB